MSYYEQGFNSSNFNPPGEPGSQAYRDYQEGWGEGGLLRTMNNIRESEVAAKERAKNDVPPTKFNIVAGLFVYLSLGIYILSYFHLLKIALCILLGLGFAGWLIFIGKGKWVLWPALVVALFVGGWWVCVLLFG